MTIKTLDPKSAVLVFTFACIGFVLAFLPFKADMDIRNSSKRGDLKGMIENLSKPGATSFHYSQVAFQASQGGFPEQAKEVNKKLVEKFPRDFGGWLTEFSRSGTDLTLSTAAKQKVESIDPYFFCLQNDWANRMSTVLRSIPIEKQKEISIFWNLFPGGQEANSVAFARIPLETWNLKLTSNCS